MFTMIADQILCFNTPVKGCQVIYRSLIYLVFNVSRSGTTFKRLFWTVNVNYCRTGSCNGHDIFADFAGLNKTAKILLLQKVVYH